MLKATKSDATVEYDECEEETFKLEGFNTFLDTDEGVTRFMFVHVSILGEEWVSSVSVGLAHLNAGYLLDDSLTIYFLLTKVSSLSSSSIVKVRSFSSFAVIKLSSSSIVIESS